MCSPLLCADPGFFVPGDGATVPANLPGIYWRARHDASPGGVTPSNVTLTTTTDPGAPLSFTATPLSDANAYLLVPDAPLVAGTSYRLVDSTTCMFGGGGGAPSPTVVFAVGPSAPLPTTLGVLAVTDLPPRTDSVISSGGSCSTSAVLASAAVAIDYPSVPGTAPWRDVLHFETRADGQIWFGRSSSLQSIAPGESWVGRGFDRLYTACSEDPFNDVGWELSEGTHQVEMRATLPGTSLALATGTRAVTLVCPPPGNDGDGGEGGGDGETGEGGGCCSTAERHGAGSAPWLALGVVALLLRWPARRRRGRRASSPPSPRRRPRSRPAR